MIGVLGEIVLDRQHPKWSNVCTKLMACAKSDPERLLSEAARQVNDDSLTWILLRKS